MTGLRSFDSDVFFMGQRIIVLDAQQRLSHSFAVIHNGYHTFRSVYAARKFIRSIA